jgi:hypothetical protein
VIRSWAETVEELGYQHVLAYDHVLGVGVRGASADRRFRAR